MTQLSIQGDIERATRKLKGIRGGAKKAINRATTRTASTGKTHISKEIRSEIAVKAADVNKVLTNRRKGGGREIKLEKSIRLPLKAFGARQVKAGVSYKIAKGGKRNTIKGAFIANRLGGHAFKRVGKQRTPITKLKGVSPWGAFVKNKKVKPTRKKLRETFRKRLIHEVNHLLRTAK